MRKLISRRRCYYCLLRLLFGAATITIVIGGGSTNGEGGLDLENDGQGMQSRPDLVNLLSRSSLVAVDSDQTFLPSSVISRQRAAPFGQDSGGVVVNQAIGVGSVTTTTSDPYSDLLANASTVSCYSGYFSVAVKKEDLINSTFGIVHGEQLSFRDTVDPSCRASARASNRTHFVLATLNSHCATEVLNNYYKTNDGVEMQIVKNQVIFRPKAAETATAALQAATDDAAATTFSDTRRIVVNVACTIKLEPAGGAEKVIIENEDEKEEQKTILQHLVSATAASEMLALKDSTSATTTPSNHSFRLILSDKQWTGPNAQPSWVKYPFLVVVGSRIYAQIQFSQANVEEDLKAYPKECFYSKHSDPAIEPKLKLITSGCGALGSVILHHSLSPPQNRYARLSFPLERIYFDSNYMYFHCKVVPCSLRGGRETEGYETCPNSTFCSERTIDSRYVPFDSPFSSYVSSGLMRPIIKSDDNNHDGDPNSAARQVTCPPCPGPGGVTRRPSAPEPQQAHPPAEVIISGVPVTFVVGIGFGFFLLGFLMMGGIWWVRVHTDPKRILLKRGGYTKNDRADLSLFHHVAPTSGCNGADHHNCTAPAAYGPTTVVTNNNRSSRGEDEVVPIAAAGGNGCSRTHRNNHSNA